MKYLTVIVLAGTKAIEITVRKAGVIACLTLLTFGLTSCSPQNESNKTERYHDALSWATADQNAIKNAISQILLQKTPYPDEIYFDLNGMHHKLRTLKQELRSVEAGCNHAVGGANRFTFTESTKPLAGQDCDQSSLNTSQIEKLNHEIDQQNSLISKRYAFDKRIKEQAEVELISAIRLYSQDRYRLVLDSKPRNILYNQEGIFVDITDAVIDHYRAGADK